LILDEVIKRSEPHRLLHMGTEINLFYINEALARCNFHPASPIIEGIQRFHDDIMFFVVIFFFVS
jgi:hypothetical protein